METRAGMRYDVGMEKTATDLRQLLETDHRFRMIVNQAVHQAMDDIKPFISEETRARDLHEAAYRASAMALKLAFDGDAELTATRIERDHYKALAEKMLVMAPVRMLTTKPV